MEQQLKNQEKILEQHGARLLNINKANLWKN